MYQLDKYKAKPDKTIAEHTNDLIRQLELIKLYGYIKDNWLYELSRKACELHDIGKMNTKFQIRIDSKKKIKFDPSKEVPHNILSGCMIDKNDFIDKESYLLVLHAVLYHHDYVEVTNYLREEEELIKKALEEFNKEYSISARDVKGLSKIIESNHAILIKGILHKCDYSASAGLTCEYKADFLEQALEEFILKLQQKNKSKEIIWNNMQEYCRQNKDRNIIVIAQTGMGKTEGALHWIGNQKGFFVLPLRTAINAIYERIKKEIINEVSTKERVAILHSSSLAYYMGQDEEIDEQEAQEIIQYERLSKQWSMPLNITTMDQLFDFVFKYQGYELKLSTLAYSKIVVDEIQMYDPQLLAYLIYGLERIYQLGGKIAIITATLPPFVQDLLCKKIGFEPKEEFYNEERVRHYIKIKEEAISIEDIYEKYNKNKKLGKSNKLLVICNTVKKAREVYVALMELLGEQQVKALHSRFIRYDRQQLENEIKVFGRTYNEEGNIDCNEGIWVSTSLVEASLDIDFDCLFTELQELSSLFQRLGRCNRKGEKSIAEVNCYIYTEIDPAIIIHGDKGFIDERLYSLSKEAIKNKSGWLSEKTKIELINTTFKSENMQGSSYINQYNEAYNLINNMMVYKIEKNEVVLRQIFSQDIIPSPIYIKNQEKIEELVTKLNEFNLNLYEKLKLEEMLMGYTVSIPSYEIKKYKTAVIKNKAEVYKVLKWGRFNRLQIIDCEYDSRGFVPKIFDNMQSGEGEFL